MTLRFIRNGSAAALVLAGALCGAWACSSNESKPAVAADSKAPAGLDESIQHEKCDASMGRADAVDANNDGKADITNVVDAKSGRNVCRVTDFNHDGKAEMYEYWDDAGNLRRRELAFENTEAISAIEIYKGGKLTERMLDTTGQRRIDTWDHYDDSGRRTKRERDTNNTGRIDQWWAFNDDGTITIAVDKNGDGQPAPEDTITVTASGAAIAPDAGGPAPSGSASSDGGASNAPPPPPPPPVLMPETVADAGVADGGKKKKASK